MLSSPISQSVWLAQVDYVLLPALVLFLAVTAYAIVRRWRKK